MVSALTSQALDVLKKQFSVTDVPVTWTYPRELQFGDLSTNVALALGKKVGKSPLSIAEALAEALSSSDLVTKAEAVKPGYVNIWVKPSALIRSLSDVEHAIIPATMRDEAPVIVEYSQPNIAKPLGVHHIIGTVLGQSIVNLYRHAGYKVVAWNYMGDWGTQFGKLAVAYEKWGSGKPVLNFTLNELLALYVRFHDEVEKDDTLDKQARDAFRALERGDKTLRVFWENVVSVTKSSLAGIYDRLHVSFDLDLSESFYEDKMKPILDEGRTKGVFTEGEGGALIVEFPEAKNMPPYLVLKGDGATLYSTRDLAQMRYRIDTYHPKEILILTDIAQKLHFEQLVETCRMLGWELPEFENVLFGRMRFADKSMSTRKGNILNLEQVLDEAVKRADAIIAERGDAIQTDDPKELGKMMGIGALVYGILSQNRKMDLVFDWDKMLSFEGNSAPYLQYSHARARSVLRKAEVGDGLPFPPDIRSLVDSERALIRTLLLLPSVLEEARSMRMPHRLATFLYQLAQDFNAFYNEVPIVKANEPERSLRLALTSLTARVLRIGADIMTLGVPERM